MFCRGRTWPCSTPPARQQRRPAALPVEQAKGRWGPRPLPWLCCMSWRPKQGEHVCLAMSFIILQRGRAMHLDVKDRTQPWCTLQASDGMACNAWLFCGEQGGCHNSSMSFGASQNTCSLYYASDLEYNTPLDKNVGVLRGANVTFTSGESPHAALCTKGRTWTCKAHDFMRCAIVRSI